jgi:RNA polymerase sigma-70 factor (family 1)
MSVQQSRRFGLPVSTDYTEDNHSEETVVYNNETLIRRAFEQNMQRGCELLYRQYYVPLCSHAVRFVYSQEIAQDIVQDVFCRFYTDNTFARITTSYRAYLYKTVRNRAYNYLRWELNRQAELEQVTSLPSDEGQQPDGVTQFEELYHDVEAAINALPVQRRNIYLMNRFEGKKYAEIAAELSISPRTVEVQIRRASHYIRDLLKDKWTL